MSKSNYLDSITRWFRHSVRAAVGWGLLFLCLCCLPEPVLALQLTQVTHLFDIKHDFSYPSDVAVSPDGRIYVLDGVNHCVKVFKAGGRFDYAFGEKGRELGDFYFPLGIDVGASGRVYVADSGNHRVQVFTGQGRFLYQLVLPETGGKAPDPTDVAVDEETGRCFVADNDNHMIVVFDLKSRETIKTYGTPGAEKREFRYPFLMTIDQNKILYIIDAVNTRVQALTADGRFVAIIGGWGVEPGNFFRPKGVAVDSKGLVYVSDGYMGVIQAFQSNGWFHSVIADNETGEVKKFNNPVGLFIDRHNRLYVVEMFAQKVSVYDIGETVTQKDGH